MYSRQAKGPLERASVDNVDRCGSCSKLYDLGDIHWCSEAECNLSAVTNCYKWLEENTGDKRDSDKA